ncbi:D-alanyl-D-alanine carboxypeptidase/D-alanyl-D-alanine-endopeptidase [Leptolyngbya sp. FACHB-36]|uniref:D-alanyl-D-alanine carboxypeptidase/D-alanyl-D-alanine endopeptidase n=1 Tax=Leptolyngbya sp. FACHB-36 TaxID=2692808 RepID=UPI001681A955|nr:D-alanyl-D-alanine carboxypeptidase/D-alanyl-D-alanine-endopeptidase [Leptolyngbya sp. FACHB-36]MBD2021671.1 D-alanyl-D-alanine carboxypeptidase/D-alanyl-D-alanine-endopeptidase [Leptolyngbya sp. FACHB-36]
MNTPRSRFAFVSPLLVLAVSLNTPTAAIASTNAETAGRSSITRLAAEPKQAPTGICPAQVGSALTQIITRSGLGQTRLGVLVQTQGTGRQQNLFARNATTLLIPASNNKVLTTAAALQRLGASYRIRTAVYGSTTGPTLETLRIIGQGDPSLTTPQLNSLVQQVSQKGVRQVGQLIGDDTYFRGPATNPNWDPSDLTEAYAAGINSLILNQNAIGLTLVPQRVGQPLQARWDDPTDASDWILENRTVTVSPSAGESLDTVRSGNTIRLGGQLRAGSESELVGVAVPNPGNYLVGKFRKLLTNARIAVTNSTLVKLTPAPPGLVELAAVESPPLSELLFETNQESNNVFAEALLKTLGRLQSPASQNATDSGVAAVKAILTPLGVNPNGISTVDGSGLAVRNRISPEALVQTLQVIAQNRDAAVFRRSLPVAGVSGTLKNRFRNTAAQGVVFAKTGTITGVVGLSGYVTPPNGPPLVFSILANYSGLSTTDVRSAVDQMVVVLARVRSC